MERDREFMEDFINIYRMHPCLWDIKSKEYTDRQLKNNAYELLIEKCKEIYPTANKDFVVKKIHSMRCSFRREFKKVLDSQKKTGSSVDDVYTPNLWYYDLLSFIIDSETPRKGKSNIITDKLTVQAEEAGSDTENEVHSDVDERSVQDDNISVTSPASQITVPSSRPSSSTSSLSTARTVPSQKKKSTTQQELFTLAAKTLKTYNDNASSQTSSKHQIEEDEYSVDGKKFAFDLKMMNNDQRILTERLVSEVIFYGKLNKLTEYSSFQLGGQIQQNTELTNSNGTYTPRNYINANYLQPTSILTGYHSASSNTYATLNNIQSHGHAVVQNPTEAATAELAPFLNFNK